MSFRGGRISQTLLKMFDELARKIIAVSLLASGIYWPSRGASCQDVPRRTSRAAGRLPRVTMEVEALVAQLLPTEDETRIQSFTTWVPSWCGPW